MNTHLQPPAVTHMTYNSWNWLSLEGSWWDRQKEPKHLKCVCAKGHADDASRSNVTDKWHQFGKSPLEDMWFGVWQRCMQEWFPCTLLVMKYNMVQIFLWVMDTHTFGKMGSLWSVSTDSGSQIRWARSVYWALTWQLVGSRPAGYILDCIECMYEYACMHHAPYCIECMYACMHHALYCIECMYACMHHALYCIECMYEYACMHHAPYCIECMYACMHASCLELYRMYVCMYASCPYIECIV